MDQNIVLLYYYTLTLVLFTMLSIVLGQCLERNSTAYFYMYSFNKAEYCISILCRLTLVLFTTLCIVFRAVFGKNFYSEVTGENVGALKGSMLVETLICVLLYFIRSFYPNLLMASLTDLELEENKQVGGVYNMCLSA